MKERHNTQFYGPSILETLLIMVAAVQAQQLACTSVVCLGAVRPHATHCGTVYCLHCGQASEWVEVQEVAHATEV